MSKLSPLSCMKFLIHSSVMTPYYSEETVYSKSDLEMENEDGISIIYYLQKIYPDEWDNFIERLSCKECEIWETEENILQLRHWASLRGQTLCRTIRGMMYYRRALMLQAFLDMAKESELGNITKLLYHQSQNGVNCWMRWQSLLQRSIALSFFKNPDLLNTSALSGQACQRANSTGWQYGARAYYTNRRQVLLSLLQVILIVCTFGDTSGQPPLLSAMIVDIYDRTGDLEFVRKTLPALLTEHKFWNSDGT